MTTLALNLRSIPTPPKPRAAGPTAPAAYDEPALVKAFARGEASAVEQVYRSCLAPVYAYAAARLGDRSEAEDVVQETFLTALRVAGGFDGRSSLLTWLTGIARNKARERLRAIVTARRRNAGAVEAAAQLLKIEDEALPEHAMRAAETGRLVGDALALLPERHRAALKAKYLDGLSLAAIGEREGVSAKAAESTVVRARRGFISALKTLARRRIQEDRP